MYTMIDQKSNIEDYLKPNFKTTLGSSILSTRRNYLRHMNVKFENMVEVPSHFWAKVESLAQQVAMTEEDGTLMARVCLGPIPTCKMV